MSAPPPFGSVKSWFKMTAYILIMCTNANCERNTHLSTRTAVRLHRSCAALPVCPCEFTYFGFSALSCFFEKVSDPSVPSAGLAAQCTHIIHLPDQRGHGGSTTLRGLSLSLLTNAAYVNRNNFNKLSATRVLDPHKEESLFGCMKGAFRKKEKKVSLFVFS